MKGKDSFRAKINEEEEEEEFSMIQTSKMRMAPKTKEDWERQKARVYGRKKDLNEIDFNILEGSQESYENIM